MQNSALFIALAVGLTLFAIIVAGRKKTSKMSNVAHATTDAPNISQLPKLRELDARLSGLVARVRLSLEQSGLPTEFVESLAKNLVHLRRLQDQVTPLINDAHQQTLLNLGVAKSFIKQAAKLDLEFAEQAVEVERTLKEVHEFLAAKYLDELGNS